MSWVTVTPPKFKHVTLLIRHAEWYTFPELVADVKEQMPEVVEQLEEIICNLCGGTNGNKMNAAVLMPMVKHEKEESILSELPEEAQRLIRSLMIKEVQRESRTVSECKFRVPVDFTLEQLRKTVESEIGYSELVSIYDYVYTPTFSTNHGGGGWCASIYFAVNHHKTDQLIYNLINENTRNIVSSLNQISITAYNPY